MMYLLTAAAARQTVEVLPTLRDELLEEQQRAQRAFAQASDSGESPLYDSDRLVLFKKLARDLDRAEAAANAAIAASIRDSSWESEATIAAMGRQISDAFDEIFALEVLLGHHGWVDYRDRLTKPRETLFALTVEVRKQAQVVLAPTEVQESEHNWQAGRYAGKTQDGNQLEFYVSNDLTYIERFTFTVKIMTLAIGAVVGQKFYTFPTTLNNVPIKSDGSFSFTDSGDVSVTLDGAIGDKRAGGTLQVFMRRTSITLTTTHIENGQTPVLTWRAVAD